MTITLTTDQQAASDKLYRFLCGPDKIFVLSGVSGSGKSTLLKNLQDVVWPRYQQFCKLTETSGLRHFNFLASTNKAARHLSSVTKQDVLTVHSFFQIKPKMDYNTGKKHLTTSTKNTYSPHLFIIDEASMLNQEVLDIVFDLGSKSKFIFVGDHAQLPPVGSSKAPVFENVDPTQSVFLTEVLRSRSAPDITDLCAQLRQNVETGMFSPLPDASENVTFLARSHAPLHIKKVFSDPDASATVTAYTNSQVDDYTHFIRQDVKGFSEWPTVGETMVLSETFRRPSHFVPPETPVEITFTGKVGTFAEGFEDLGLQPVPCLYMEGIMDNSTILFPYVPQIRSILQALRRRKLFYAKEELELKVPQLRFTHASTVHKAQGSTYDHVFVDLGNIGTCHDPETVARLLYVATSRARKHLYFIGELPAKYTHNTGVPQWTCAASPTPSSTASLKKIPNSYSISKSVSSKSM